MKWRVILGLNLEQVIARLERNDAEDTFCRRDGGDALAALQASERNIGRCYGAGGSASDLFANDPFESGGAKGLLTRNALGRTCFLGDLRCRSGLLSTQTRNEKARSADKKCHKTQGGEE